MPARIALYYPYIHFRDEAWLKLAALYWSEIKRIVPADYPKRDSATVQALADAGCVSDRHPEGSADVKVAHAFLALINEHQDDLRSRFAIDRTAVWTSPPPLHGGHSTGERFAYIHVTKLSPRLVEALADVSLATLGRDGDPDWVAVHPTLAEVYMTALADDVAVRTGFHPVTEDAAHYEAVGGWSVDRIAQTLLGLPDESGPKDVPVSLAFLSIAALMPADIAGVSVERIIDVRQRYRAEMLAFQDAVAKFADDLAPLAAISDADAFAQHLRLEHERRIVPELENLKRSLKLFKLDTVPTALGVKLTIPAAATVSTQFGFDEPALSGAAGVAFGLITLRQTRRARVLADTKSSPAAYLMQIEEGLTPGNLLDRASRATRKLVTGA